MSGKYCALKKLSVTSLPSFRRQTDIFDGIFSTSFARQSGEYIIFVLEKLVVKNAVNRNQVLDRRVNATVIEGIEAASRSAVPIAIISASLVQHRLT